MCHLLKADISLLSGSSIHWWNWTAGVSYCYCVAIFRPFISINNYFINFRASRVCGYVYINKCYVFLMEFSLNYYKMSIFVICYHFCLKIYFVWYKYDYICFSLYTICLKHHLPTLHSETVFGARMSFLKTAHHWILVFNLSGYSLLLNYI